MRESHTIMDTTTKTQRTEDRERAAPTPLPTATASQRILGDSNKLLQLLGPRLHLIEGSVASTITHQLRLEEQGGNSEEP
jgi:hypothetical protein